ncbi:MAG: pilus assembly protein [Deltaproteobacteria bacterium]|nr:pilus assembly protein [Deltaproteobacteria bacterium]
MRGLVPSRSPRRGAAAVEFGLILPVLLVILFGIFDFAWVFHQHGILTRALRDGCRSGAVVPITGDPVTTAESAILANLTAGGFACGGTCTPTVAWEEIVTDKLWVLDCTLTVPVMALSGLTVGTTGLTLTTATRANIEMWEP